MTGKSIKTIFKYTSYLNIIQQNLLSKCYTSNLHTTNKYLCVFKSCWSNLKLIRSFEYTILCFLTVHMLFNSACHSRSFYKFKYVDTFLLTPRNSGIQWGNIAMIRSTPRRQTAYQPQLVADRVCIHCVCVHFSYLMNFTSTSFNWSVHSSVFGCRRRLAKYCAKYCCSNRTISITCGNSSRWWCHH